MIEFVQLKNGDSSAKIHLFGATVISWKRQGIEQLFLSKLAVLDGSKPIRGGIPIVFPQFGTGEIMEGQHGFARRQWWSVSDSSSLSASIELCSNADTLEQWPFKFKLCLSLELSPEGCLYMNFKVKNCDEKIFNFTCLLHTYFSVTNGLENVSISPLAGLRYTDKLLENSLLKQSDDSLKIDREIDRCYQNAPNVITLNRNTGIVKICKSGFSDVVIWNPWIEKSKSMTDFEDNEFMSMVCIEVGAVNDLISLKPGCTWMASQRLF